VSTLPLCPTFQQLNPENGLDRSPVRNAAEDWRVWERRVGVIKSPRAFNWVARKGWPPASATGEYRGVPSQYVFTIPELRSRSINFPVEDFPRNRFASVLFQGSRDGFVKYQPSC
jgi:hypothetical protein